MTYAPVLRTNFPSKTFLVLGLSTLLSVPGCGDGPVEPPDPLAVASVAVTAPSPDLEAGKTVQLDATAKNASGEALPGKSFIWSSSSDSIATVTAEGVVTAKRTGAVTITAESEGKKGTTTINVKAGPITNVGLVPESASIQVGDTLQIQLRQFDALGNGTSVPPVNSTSDPAIATVSARGLVKGIAPGTATITATAGGKVATAVITVTPVSVVPLVVSPSRATIRVGDALQLSTILRDANGNVLPLPSAGSFSYSSSNPALATVSSSGRVTGMATGGPVTITVNVSGRSATTSITVGPPPR